MPKLLIVSAISSLKFAQRPKIKYFGALS